MTAAVPVEMLQHREEFEQLLDLYRQRRPKRTLEIGVHLGGTLYHWLEYAPAGATIVALDDRHLNRGAYRDWRRSDVRLVVIEGASGDLRTAQAAARYGPYDWIFIDADHHEPAVESDWKTYAPLAAPAGLIALHDITPTDDPTIEVDRFWRVLSAHFGPKGRTAEITEPGGFGIGIVYGPDNE